LTDPPFRRTEPPLFPEPVSPAETLTEPPIPDVEAPVLASTLPFSIEIAPDAPLVENPLWRFMDPLLSAPVPV
jgi:hypothetical protein